MFSEVVEEEILSVDLSKQEESVSEDAENEVLVKKYKTFKIKVKEESKDEEENLNRAT